MKTIIWLFCLNGEQTTIMRDDSWKVTESLKTKVGDDPQVNLSVSWTVRGFWTTDEQADWWQTLWLCMDSREQ